MRIYNIKNNLPKVRSSKISHPPSISCCQVYYSPPISWVDSYLNIFYYLFHIYLLYNKLFNIIKQVIHIYIFLMYNMSTIYISLSIVSHYLEYILYIIDPNTYIYLYSLFTSIFTHYIHKQSYIYLFIYSLYTFNPTVDTYKDIFFIFISYIYFL